MRKILLFGIVLLCLISFVSAEPDYFFKQSSQIDLKITCFNSTSSVCDSTTLCNITILYPNQSALINNLAMTWNVNYYNFTLSQAHTTILGEYPTSIICDGEEDGFSTFSFKITPNGEEPTAATAFFYFGAVFIIVFFILISIIGFMRVESIWVKYTLFCTVYLLISALSFVLWRMTEGFLTSAPFLVYFLKLMFYLSMWLLFPFILVSFLYTLYLIYNIKEIQNLVNKGMPHEEASERIKNKRKHR